MSKVDRRDFLKTTTAAAAAASLPLTEQAKAAPPLVDIDQPIPPQRVELLYGLHAYTDQLSVEPGDEIQFHATSTVPYQLSVCRLGEEVDDPNGDQVFVQYPEAPPRLQPIRPGSYVHVERGLAPRNRSTRSLWSVGSGLFFVTNHRALSLNSTCPKPRPLPSFSTPTGDSVFISVTAKDTRVGNCITLPQMP